MVIAHVVGSPEFYWAVVAELSLVVWTALLLVAAGRRRDDRWRFALTAFGAAVLASLITLAGKTLEVWPGNPLFPSGHTAYVVTIAVLLVARDRRWLRVVIPLAPLMAVALVLANYHVPEDIAGGAAVGVIVGGTAVTWLDRRRLRGEPSARSR